MSEEEYALFSATVVDLLSRAGIAIPELTTMVYKDAEELTKLLLKETANVRKTKNGKDKKEDPVENALMYLSTRYKTFFGNRDTLALAFQLSKDIQNTNDTALFNALKIVCEDETVYEPQLKKYGISRDALNTIQKWYCMSVHGN
ncbi:hypothetical protein [Segatella bryantii]|uniref:hypothetical protein n=1 Tax=Segatella bryantii TaxID=77095 RepID=UPI00242E5F78|nr:hypothetical protein [Segatella bryantii]